MVAGETEVTGQLELVVVWLNLVAALLCCDLSPLCGERPTRVDLVIDGILAARRHPDVITVGRFPKLRVHESRYIQCVHRSIANSLFIALLHGTKELVRPILIVIKDWEDPCSIRADTLVLCGVRQAAKRARSSDVEALPSTTTEEDSMREATMVGPSG